VRDDLGLGRLPGRQRGPTAVQPDRHDPDRHERSGPNLHLRQTSLQVSVDARFYLAGGSRGNPGAAISVACSAAGGRPQHLLHVIPAVWRQLLVGALEGRRPSLVEDLEVSSRALDERAVPYMQDAATISSLVTVKVFMPCIMPPGVSVTVARANATCMIPDAVRPVSHLQRRTNAHLRAPVVVRESRISARPSRIIAWRPSLE
jgi:hypothetical protein